MFAVRFVLPANEAVVAPTRRRVLAVIRSWGRHLGDEIEDVLQLIVSELVTNAVLHGRGSLVSVGLYLRDDRLLISVYDASGRPPSAGSPDDHSESGRGLILVGALASRHGWEPTPRGKRCWAELELPKPKTASHRSQPGRAARSLQAPACASSAGCTQAAWRGVIA